MFLFGHLGVGSKLVSPFSRGLSRRAILFGTILPDLIDKPLYYIAAWSTGKVGAEIGLLSCSRLFAHTAIFLILLATIAWVRRSRLFAALALGVATHLLLDAVSDSFFRGREGSALLALVWPYYGRFGAMDTKTVGEHLWRLATAHVIVFEVAGAGILSWDYWKARHKHEILHSAWRNRPLLRIFRRAHRQRTDSRPNPKA